MPPPAPRPRRGTARSLRLGLAAGATGLAVVLFVMPRYSLPDPGGTLIWGLPSGPTVHVALCAVVAFLWVRALPGVRPLRLLVWGALLAVGAEVLQLLPFVDRGVSVGDAGSNVLGVGLGWLLAVTGRRVRSRGV